LDPTSQKYEVKHPYNISTLNSFTYTAHVDLIFNNRGILITTHKNQATDKVTNKQMPYQTFLYVILMQNITSTDAKSPDILIL